MCPRMSWEWFGAKGDAVPPEGDKLPPEGVMVPPVGVVRVLQPINSVRRELVRRITPHNSLRRE